jgi:hypothetical protein
LTAGEAQALLNQASGMFDLAIEVRRRPHPFQHKMHAHLKPYFVDTCQGMIDEGFPREAAGWTTPFFLTATDILKVDGPESDRALYAARQNEFLRRLGLDTVERRNRRFEEAEAVAGEVFALAEQMIAANPLVVA